MNYAAIKRFDVANGSGISTTLFVSGCRFHCEGCHNLEAQDFNYGNEFTKDIEDMFIDYANNSHVNHVSILGGEPFQQDYKILKHLFKRLKYEVNKPIWLWTGYTYEQLTVDKYKKQLLSYIDVLIDGRFIKELKDIKLKFRGSSNQRIINVQESLRQNKVIEYNF